MPCEKRNPQSAGKLSVRGALESRLMQHEERQSACREEVVVDEWVKQDIHAGDKSKHYYFQT